jgi:hypothetical protein
MSKCFTLTRGQCKYLSNTLTRPLVNFGGSVNVITKIVRKVTLSLSLFFSPPNPSFKSIHKIIQKKFNLGMKCRESAFNAQGSRLIIVVFTSSRSQWKYMQQQWTCYRKREIQGETQFTTKTEVPPPLNANVF